MKEIMLLKRKRNEFGKQIRKGYEKHMIKARVCEIHDWTPNDAVVSPTITTMCFMDMMILEIEDE